MKVKTVPRKISKEPIEHMEIFNGQVYRQKVFPFSSVVILMLDRYKGEMQFCKAGFSDNQVPLVKVDFDGSLMYSEKEMIESLRRLNYTYIGSAKINVVPLIRFNTKED